MLQWRVRVHGSVSGIRVGIVSAQFTAWGSPLGNTSTRQRDNDGNAKSGFGFHGGGSTYSKLAGVSCLAVEFKDGDVLMFVLDRGARTLNAVNETSGESALVCRNLPLGGTLYPAACAYSQGTAIELVEVRSCPRLQCSSNDWRR